MLLLFLLIHFCKEIGAESFYPVHKRCVNAVSKKKNAWSFYRSDSVKNPFIFRLENHNYRLHVFWAAEFDVVEEPEFDVVRTKRFAVKPMTTEEAILQMNLLDHTFYVFRNMDTSAVCVVYRRNNGGYGLIETQD